MSLDTLKKTITILWTDRLKLLKKFFGSDTLHVLLQDPLLQNVSHNQEQVILTSVKNYIAHVTQETLKNTSQPVFCQMIWWWVASTAMRNMLYSKWQQTPLLVEKDLIQSSSFRHTPYHRLNTKIQSNHQYLWPWAFQIQDFMGTNEYPLQSIVGRIITLYHLIHWNFIESTYLWHYKSGHWYTSILETSNGIHELTSQKLLLNTWIGNEKSIEVEWTWESLLTWEAFRTIYETQWVEATRRLIQWKKISLLWWWDWMKMILEYFLEHSVTPSEVILIGEWYVHDIETNYQCLEKAMKYDSRYTWLIQKLQQWALWKVQFVSWRVDHVISSPQWIVYSLWDTEYTSDLWISAIWYSPGLENTYMYDREPVCYQWHIVWMKAVWEEIYMAWYLAYKHGAIILPDQVHQAQQLWIGFRTQRNILLCKIVYWLLQADI